MNMELLLVKLASVTDVPQGEGRAVRVGKKSIALFHTREGFKATQNACPHKEGPLADGIVAGCKVYCPLHNWGFDLCSGKGVDSAHGDIAVYPVQERDGFLFIEIAASEISE